MKRTLLMLWFLVIAVFATYPVSLYAADSSYPNRSISVVVPFAPGGMTDLAARLLSEFLEKELKQPVVVSNRAGGSQTIGGYAVAQAKPDGYTLLFSPPVAYHPEAFSYFFEAPYTSKDLVPISRLQLVPLMITTRIDAPYNDLKEFVEYARKNPPVKYGTFGKSSLGYIGISSIGRAEKLDLVEVPYAGDGELVPALLGGHVPVGGTTFPPIQASVEAKKLKILAIISEKRLPFYPSIPTTTELGYPPPPGSCNGLYGPKGLPDEIIKKLADAVTKIIEMKDFQDRANKLNLLLDYQGPDAYAKLQATSNQIYSDFFKAEGLVKK